MNDKTLSKIINISFIPFKTKMKVVILRLFLALAKTFNPGYGYVFFNKTKEKPLIQYLKIHLPKLGLIMATFLWGSSFIALKLAFQTFDPMVVIFGRMAIASIVFLVFLQFLKNAFNYQKGDLKYLFFMTLCEPCIYFIFEAKALENTTASQAGMITASLPVLVTVAAYLFLGEKATLKMMVGFCLTILGVCGLSVGSEISATAPNPLLGNFFEFLAMVSATGYIITAKHLTQRYSPFFLTAMQSFCGSFFYMFFLFMPTTQIPVTYDPVPLLAILYLGAFITLGAYGLYNYGLSHIPANQAASYINLIPFFSVFLGWIILGERFNTLQFGASALIISGVYLSQQWHAGGKG